jgi:branched-chain amino acid transport system substrate-binding protein
MGSWLQRAACAVLLVGFLLPGGAAWSQETIRIAFIAPFSGSFAPQGDAFLKQLQYALDTVNAKGGALGKRFELITFDDKLQPAEATIALKSAIDQNIPIALQCIGSNVAAAMIDGVSKHNARNAEHRILYLNCAALADDLTEEKCDFWHFRFAANVSMRVTTLVRSMPSNINTVYLINQDYLYGQSVRNQMVELLKTVRPDVKIVGDDLVPLGKIKDFAPYVAKIKASGARAVLTSNWGVDFNQLLRSGLDTGLDVQYYTLSAHINGGPTAMGEGGIDRVHSALDTHMNIPTELGDKKMEAWMQGFRDKTADFDFVWINFVTMFDFLAKAIDKAGTTDPLQIALALEGMQGKDAFGQMNTMRKDDHQLLTSFYQAVFTKSVRFDSERTGAGWKTEATIAAPDLAKPPVCNMKRPKGS